MNTNYPDLRGCSTPPFLTTKYKDINGLLGELARRTTSALPPFDEERFLASIPSIDNAFVANRDSLVNAFDVDEPAARRYADILQRLMLWENPDIVFNVVEKRLSQVIKDMPRTLYQLEVSGGGRDILDPFFVAFVSRLLGGESTIELLKALIAHKCMMKLEDLIGHLHEEVLGRAAGGDRVEEPNGEVVEGGKINKTVYHPMLNPYPGADARRGEVEFYQIKNKTGSAKGSDGTALGKQFANLGTLYKDSRRYYVSMIGRTLSGHRSMGAFMREDPGAEVLVGLAAFQQLGRHRDTPDIVMGLYIEAFEAALKENHYDFEQVVTDAAAEWAAKHGGEDPAFAILRDAIMPQATDPAGEDQVYSTYVARRIKSVAPGSKGKKKAVPLSLDFDMDVQSNNEPTVGS